MSIQVEHIENSSDLYMISFPGSLIETDATKHFATKNIYLIFYLKVTSATKLFFVIK